VQRANPSRRWLLPGANGKDLERAAGTPLSMTGPGPDSTSPISVHTLLMPSPPVAAARAGAASTAATLDRSPHKAVSSLPFQLACAGKIGSAMRSVLGSGRPGPFLPPTPRALTPFETSCRDARTPWWRALLLDNLYRRTGAKPSLL